MAKKSTFLKKILTTASILAVSASVAQAENRVITGNTNATGAANMAPAGPIANNDTLTFNADGITYTHDIADRNLTAIDVANKNIIFNTTGAGNFTIASITGTGADGMTGLTLNITDNQTITLLENAAATGLKAVKLANAGAKLQVNSGTTFNTTIDGGVGGQGELIINASDATLAKAIGGTKLAKITVNNDKTGVKATDNVSATTIEIGARAHFTVGSDGKTITATNIDGIGNDQGTLKFATGKITAAIDNIGNTADKKLNKVEIAGEVDFTTLADYKATTTEFQGATAKMTLSKDADITLESNFTTDTNGKGVIVVDTDKNRTFKGSIGTADNAFEKIELANANAQITFEQDNASINAGAVTTSAAANNGTVNIKSNNFTINADLGVEAKALKTLNIHADKAGNAAATVNLAEGKKIFAKVDLSAADQDNVLVLHNNTLIKGDVIAGHNKKGIISVKGDATISGNIGAGGNKINKLSIDAAEKTLTLKDAKAAYGVNGGVVFNEDGAIKFTTTGDIENRDMPVTIAKVAEGGVGMGSIIADQAPAGTEVSLVDAVGNVADKKYLKLLQVKGGADISVADGKNIAIKTIDIGSADSKLTIDGDQFVIGKYAHDDKKGKIEVGATGAATLKAGSIYSTADNRLNSVDLNDGNLVLEDGIDLYTANGIKTANAGEGFLEIKGKSEIAGVVGAADKAIKGFVVSKDGVANFHNRVYLGTTGDLDAGATVTFKDGVKGGTIDGKAAGQGTVKFVNTKTLAGDNKVTTKLGNANGIHAIEIAGASLTIDNTDLKTTQLIFSGENDTTLTFENLGENKLNGTTITGATNHSIQLTNNDFTFDSGVGTPDRPFGDIILGGDKAVTVSGIFHAGLKAKANNQGTLNLNYTDASYSNLGVKEKAFKIVNFQQNAAVKDGLWANEINVDANKTIKITGETGGAENSKINLHEGSAIEFGKVTLGHIVATDATGHGSLKFTDKAVISKNIGTGDVKLASVKFNATDVKGATSTAKGFINADAIHVTNHNIKLNGLLAFHGTTEVAKGSVLNIGTNQLVFSGGESKFTGSSTIAVTADKDQNIGAVNVSGENSKLDLSQAEAIKLVINDESTVLPTEAKSFAIFKAANKATLTLGNKISVDTSSGALANRFVKWSYAEGKLTRAAGGEERVAEIYGTTAAKEMVKYLNSENTDDAAAYYQELALMKNDERAKESGERLLEQASAYSDQVMASTTENVTGAITNRIGAVATINTTPVQTASGNYSGVAAGEEDAALATGVWFSPFYSTTSQKKRTNRSGFNSKTYGATIGADTLVDEGSLLGLAFTGMKSDIKHKDVKAGDKTKLTNFMVTVYGKQAIDNNWYVQGQASFSHGKVKSDQKRIAQTTTETAQAKFNVNSFDVGLTTGYHITTDEACITPSFGLEFNRVNSGSYKEKGTTNQNLEVTRKATNKLDAVLGVRVQLNNIDEEFNLSPEIHGSVRYDFLGKGAKITAKHKGLAAKELNSAKVKPQRVKFNVGASLNAKTDMIEYGLGYDAFAAEKSMTHQGTLKVRLNF